MKKDDLLFDKIYATSKYLLAILLLANISVHALLYFNDLTLNFSVIKLPFILTAAIVADALIGFIAFAVVPSRLWFTSFFIYITPFGLALFEYLKAKKFDYEAELFLFILFLVSQLILIGILRTAQYVKRKNQISNQE